MNVLFALHMRETGKRISCVITEINKFYVSSESCNHILPTIFMCHSFKIKSKVTNKIKKMMDGNDRIKISIRVNTHSLTLKDKNLFVIIIKNNQ